MLLQRFKFFSLVVVFVASFFLQTSKVQADFLHTDCSELGVEVLNGIGATVPKNAPDFSIKIDAEYLENDSYRIKVYDNSSWIEAAGMLFGRFPRPQSTSEKIIKTTSNTTLDFKLVGRGISSDDLFSSIDTKHVYLYKGDDIVNTCKLGTFNTTGDGLINTDLTCSSLDIYQERTLPPENGDVVPQNIKCYNSGCLDNKSPIFISGGEFKSKSELLNNYEMIIKCNEAGRGVCADFFNVSTTNGSINLNRVFDTGTYRLIPQSGTLTINFKGSCQSNSNFTVVEQCPATDCNQNKLGEYNASPFFLCDQISDKDLKDDCEKCAGDDLQDAAGIWTAVGCIKREPTALISSLIQIGLSVAGGVTLLVILSAGFMLTTSQGDPKKAGEAKEMITAAVIGILFIIFSVTILQFIGYNILKIPGFGG